MFEDESYRPLCEFPSQSTDFVSGQCPLHFSPEISISTCSYFITAHKRSCGKIMFLHVSVHLFTGGCHTPRDRPFLERTGNQTENDIIPPFGRSMIPGSKWHHTPRTIKAGSTAFFFLKKAIWWTLVPFLGSMTTLVILSSQFAK